MASMPYRHTRKHATPSLCDQWTLRNSFGEDNEISSWALDAPDLRKSYKHFQKDVYFLSSVYHESESISHSVASNSATPWPARLLCPWHSPGKNAAVSCHSHLQGIFLTQGSNPGLLHCRQILHGLSLLRSYLFHIYIAI